MSSVVVNRTSSAIPPLGNHTAAVYIPNPSNGPRAANTTLASYAPPSRAHIFFYTWKIDQWIVLVAVFLVPLIISVFIPPACRFFQLEDYSINFPFTEKEMFPDYSLGFVVVLPIVLIYFPVIYFWRATASNKNRLKELNAWTLTHLMAVGLALGMINATKVMGGRYRPDFVARLRREGIVNATPVYPPVFNAGYGYETICERKWLLSNSITHDGHLSFPSGHSGTAFSAMLPLCLFLVSRLRPFFTESLLRLVACLSPLVLAWVIALSRTIDYRHNYSDILAGGVIGVICGVFTLTIHFTYIPAVGVWALKVPRHEHDEHVVGRMLRRAARIEAAANTTATNSTVTSSVPMQHEKSPPRTNYPTAGEIISTDNSSVICDRGSNSVVAFANTTVSCNTNTNNVASPHAVPMGDTFAMNARGANNSIDDNAEDTDDEADYITHRSRVAYFRTTNGATPQGTGNFRSKSNEQTMLNPR